MVLFMDVIQERIDFKPFCDPEFHRYDLALPFVIDGYEYATDARIVIRRPSPELSKTSGRRLPDPTLLFQDWPTDGFEPFPDPEPDRRCSECVYGKVTCRTCNHEHPCKRCNGTGYDRAWVGRYVFDTRYCDLIRSLPDVRFLTVPGNHQMYFQSGEIQGRLAATTGKSGATAKERDNAGNVIVE